MATVWSSRPGLCFHDQETRYGGRTRLLATSIEGRGVIDWFLSKKKRKTV